MVMDTAIQMARERGVLSARELAHKGVSPARLKRLVAAGTMVRAARGLYTLAEYGVTENHSLVEAVRVQSRGVICLLSALRFHGIGTQLPHEVWLAVPYGSRISNTRLPLRVVVLRHAYYEAGIEVHVLEGVDVPIYSLGKTVADCFKFRNKIGIDVAIEALREALRERRCDREEIRQFASINRVERVMRPYMEVLST